MLDMVQKGRKREMTVILTVAQVFSNPALRPYFLKRDEGKYSGQDLEILSKLEFWPNFISSWI